MQKITHGLDSARNGRRIRRISRRIHVGWHYSNRQNPVFSVKEIHQSLPMANIPVSVPKQPQIKPKSKPIKSIPVEIETGVSCEDCITID